ncbi:MAG TPA: hypothetical protein PLL92_00465 [Alicycliphilus sp.]|nr:hypothetical protein [Alicycliphilus sp.]
MSVVGVFLPEGIEAEVCADIARRQQMGINKYGTTVADNPLSLRQWLTHQYEELLDAAIYCKRAIAEIDAQELRDLDDMIRAGRLPESIGTCGNVGEGEA